MINKVKSKEFNSDIIETVDGCAVEGGSYWERLKYNLTHILGGLIMEKGEDGTWTVSIGRVAWWVAFIPAVIIWIHNGQLDPSKAMKDIAPNHFNTLVFLAGYNFGKKLTDTAKVIFAPKNEVAPTIPQPQASLPPQNNANEGPFASSK